MGRHREGWGADIFPEREEMAVLLEVIDCFRFPFVDLDLFHAGIALDINQVTDRAKIIVHVMRSADVQGTVCLTVERPYLLDAHSSALHRILEAGTVAPAPLESMLLSESAQRLGRIGVVVGDVEGDRIVGIVQRVLDVVDLMTETLETHDVVDVLPDDSGDRHAAHESQDDDLFAFHERFSCS